VCNNCSDISNVKKVLSRLFPPNFCLASLKFLNVRIYRYLIAVTRQLVFTYANWTWWDFTFCLLIVARPDFLRTDSASCADRATTFVRSYGTLLRTNRSITFLCCAYILYNCYKIIYVVSNSAYTKRAYFVCYELW